MPVHGEKMLSILKGLAASDATWTLRELADFVGVSHMYVSMVEKDLTKEGLVRRNNENRIEVVDKEAILNYLQVNNRLQSAIDESMFLPLSPESILRTVANIGDREGLKYAVTGPMGLWVRSKHTPPVNVHSFIYKGELRTWREKLKIEGAAKATRANSNLFLIETKENMIFIQGERVEGITIAPLIQIYLDCKSIGGRYAEGAEELWQG